MGGPNHCKLLAGNFPKVIQALLGMAALSLLLIKRARSKNPRPQLIWFLDVVKQAISGLVAHFSGLVIAKGLGENNECGWYFVAFVVDSSIGVFLSIAFLKLSSIAARYIHWDSLSNTGLYYYYVQIDGAVDTSSDQPIVLYSVYAKQTFQWALCTLIARICCGGIDRMFWHPLDDIATAVSEPFTGHPHIFLVFVMVVCPFGFNGLQAWIQDNYLRFTGKNREVETPSGRIHQEFENVNANNDISISCERPPLVRRPLRPPGLKLQENNILHGGMRGNGSPEDYENDSDENNNSES